MIERYAKFLYEFLTYKRWGLADHQTKHRYRVAAEHVLLRAKQ